MRSSFSRVRSLRTLPVFSVVFGSIDDVALAFRERAVLDAARDDDQLPRLEYDIAVAELHAHPPGGDEEQLILPIVVVPDELALEPDHLHVGVVQLGDDLRAPRLVESRELLGQVDLVDHG